MARINTKTTVEPKRVAGGAGAIASKITFLEELERTTMSCLLWEDAAYSSGTTIAKRVAELVHLVPMQDVANIAVRIRTQHHLRHIPLLLVRELARHPALADSPGVVSDTLDKVILRPDEINEFLAIYWKDKKQPISKQVKLGLSKALLKFNEYSLAKYNSVKNIRLRDVMFLTHPNPSLEGDIFVKDHRKNESLFKAARPKGLDAKEQLFSKLTANNLAVPDTWETNLSGGADKKETFARLMSENNLGDLAFIRNLRNMVEAGVDQKAIREYGDSRTWDKVLPFRFISAAKAAPGLETSIDSWLLKGTIKLPKIKGSTLLVVDTSGSMARLISANSEMTRLGAAAALTALVREVCEEPTIYVTAGSDSSRTHATKLIPARRGMSLIDYISAGQVTKEIGGGGIFLAQCLDFIDTEQKGKQFDRVIVFTDEQDCDHKLNPNTAKLLGKNNYLVNIATEDRGIGYKKWTHINGFSESLLSFIAYSEANWN